MSKDVVVNYYERFWISDSKGEYAGYIDCDFRNNSWWVTNFYVAPEYRKYRYALILARAALQRWGHRTLYCLAGSHQDQSISNERLIVLYKHFGFEETDVPGVLKRKHDVSALAERSLEVQA